MDILIICLLLIAGIIFLLVELFLIPGTSFASILSGACMLYAIYHAFIHLGTLAGCITLLVAAILSAAFVAWFMKSKTLDRISLKKDIDGTIDHGAYDKIYVGQEGIATTRLCLMGNAQFGEDIIEVKSMDGFIEVKTPVKVVKKQSGVILVEPIG